MNFVSRTITGGAMIIFGVFLIGLAFFIEDAFWVTLIYGIPILIIGLFIWFNKKEDEIEGIKYSKKFQIGQKGGKK